MHGLEALTFTPHLGSQLPVAGRGPDQNSRQLPAKYFAEDGGRLLFSIIFAWFFGRLEYIRWLSLWRVSKLSGQTAARYVISCHVRAITRLREEKELGSCVKVRVAVADLLTCLTCEDMCRLSGIRVMKFEIGNL